MCFTIKVFNPLLFGSAEKKRRHCGGESSPSSGGEGGCCLAKAGRGGKGKEGKAYLWGCKFLTSFLLLGPGGGGTASSGRLGQE